MVHLLCRHPGSPRQLADQFWAQISALALANFLESKPHFPDIVHPSRRFSVPGTLVHSPVITTAACHPGQALQPASAKNTLGSATLNSKGPVAPVREPLAQRPSCTNRGSTAPLPVSVRDWQPPKKQQQCSSRTLPCHSFSSVSARSRSLRERISRELQASHKKYCRSC